MCFLGGDGRIVSCAGLGLFSALRMRKYFIPLTIYVRRIDIWAVQAKRDGSLFLRLRDSRR